MANGKSERIDRATKPIVESKSADLESAPLKPAQEQTAEPELIPPSEEIIKTPGSSFTFTELGVEPSVTFPAIPPEPPTRPTGPSCPNCSSTAIGIAGGMRRCNQCGNSWF